MEPGSVESDALSLERLHRIVAELTEADLAVELDPGWTVGVMLAHLAFWDRFVALRWQRALGTGQTTPGQLTDGLEDVLNDTLAAEWRAIPAAEVKALVLAAAEEVDRVVAGLPVASIEAVAAEGRDRLVDRSRHRGEHLDAIARVLAGD